MRPLLTSCSNNEMTYKIWRRFYLMPRHIHADDNSFSVSSQRSAWPFIIWIGISIIAGMGILVLGLTYMPKDPNPALMMFCVTSWLTFPLVAFAIDPIRHLYIKDSVTKVLVVTAMQTSCLRYKRVFKIVSAEGGLLGNFDLKNKRLYDEKKHLVATIFVLPSTGMKLSWLIQLFSLVSGKLSGGNVGAKNFEFVGSHGDAIAWLTRTSALTGSRELKVAKEKDKNFFLILAASLLSLE